MLLMVWGKASAECRMMFFVCKTYDGIRHDDFYILNPVMTYNGIDIGVNVFAMNNVNNANVTARM